MLLSDEEMDAILRAHVETGRVRTHWDTCHRSHYQCAILRLVDTARHYKALALELGAPPSERPQG